MGNSRARYLHWVNQVNVDKPTDQLHLLLPHRLALISTPEKVYAMCIFQKHIDMYTPQKIEIICKTHLNGASSSTSNSISAMPPHWLLLRVFAEKTCSSHQHSSSKAQPPCLPNTFWGWMWKGITQFLQTADFGRHRYTTHVWICWPKVLLQNTGSNFQVFDATVAEKLRHSARFRPPATFRSPRVVFLEHHKVS